MLIADLARTSRPHDHLQPLRRLHPLPAAAPAASPRPAAACRAIEPGMPVPAGTGLTRRTLPLARRRRARWRSTARRGWASTRCDEGIADGGDRDAEPRARHRCSCAGGMDSLSAPRAGRRRAVRDAAPDARARRRQRHDVRRGRPAAVAPQAAGLTHAARRGQGHRHPGDRLRPSRTSRTSPRATSGRSARSTSTGRFGWIGRFLDLHGDADNPLQGLSLDSDAVARAWPPPTSRSPPSHRPDDFGLWAPGVAR